MDAVRTLWLFHEKYQGFSWDLTALWKIKQIRANAEETRLGVTGALDNILIEGFQPVTPLNT